MKIRQLPSGSYNVQKMIDGVSYSLTFNKKPSAREIDRALAERVRENNERVLYKNSFIDCAQNYINMKNNVLSPSTVRGYQSILRNLSNDFLTARIDRITALSIQSEINAYSINHSPKSVKNAHGFITSVVWAYRPDMIIKTKLPQGIKPKITIPSDESVHKLIEYIRGSKYECALLLCMLGLRRSEMLAVTADKLQGNILTIDAALVSNDEGAFILKTTKTTSSTREIWVPDYVADLIRKNGVAFDGFAGNVLRYLHRAQDALGLPRCRLHDLRHYYVSMSHSLGIPDAYIQQAVGHSSVQTTRNVYLHAQTEKIEDMERRAADFLIK